MTDEDYDRTLAEMLEPLFDKLSMAFEQAAETGDTADQLFIDTILSLMATMWLRCDLSQEQVFKLAEISFKLSKRPEVLGAPTAIVQAAKVKKTLGALN